MSENNNKYGAIPSDYDPRDYRVSDIKDKDKVSGYPYSFKIEYKGKIKDQQQVCSCVAFSLAYTKEIMYEKAHKTNRRFSEGYIYGTRESNDHQGPGLVPRQALNILRKKGNVFYPKFHYNMEYPAIKSLFNGKREELDKLAKSNKIAEYYRVYTLDELKYALINIGPISAMFPIYQNNLGWVPMDNITNKEYTLNYNGETEIVGYHQMTIIGWEGDKLIVLNSYGENWGNHGTLLVDDQYPISEMWVIIEDKNSFKIKMFAKRLNKFFSSIMTAKVARWKKK